MFIKLVANSSAPNNPVAWKEWAETIRNILNGTWTSTSNLSTTYFNQGSCQIIGSKPTTNDGSDTFANFSIGTNTSQTGDNWCWFDFLHAEKSSSYGYHSNIHLNVSAGGTYGLRFRAGDGSSGSYLPYNSDSYYTVTTSDNSKYVPTFSQETTLIWANKHSFVIQQYNASYMTTQGTFGYDASAANEYQYDTIGSAKHGPFVHMGSFMASSRWNSPAYDNSTYDQFWVGANSYLAPNGQNVSLTELTPNFNLNYSTSTNNFYVSLNPQPYKNVYPLRTSTGHLHQLIPVYADPHFNRDDASYPFNGRMKTLYRTSDDISTPGSLITHDGTQYAVWMPYKTGGYHGNITNVQNQCYLIPTTVEGN